LSRFPASEMLIMVYTFDCFVAAMTCNSCGIQSPADTSTDMQTKIRPRQNRAMAALRVGDIIESDYHNIERHDYYIISKPKNPYSIKTIESWECPNCGSIDNWALVTIEDAVVKSIKEIKLDEKAAQLANYITGNCAFLGWDVRDGALVKI